ncbi:MAG: YtxH domain-containing protein [Candidatus Sericytochromatia bacterium]|nr:YtxH domain-containing protein [Candidatus Sericytochromatia bacterium]
MSTQNRSKAGAFLAWAIVGSALGGIVALLLAPRKGTETRSQLKDGVNDLFEKSAKLVDGVRQGVGKNLGSAQKSVGDKVHVISDAILAGRQATIDQNTNGAPPPKRRG